MNGTSTFQSWIESAHNSCCQSIINCIQLLPCCKRRRQVHPLPGSLSEHKFIVLAPQKCIRVIHIDCNNKYPLLIENGVISAKRTSFTHHRQNCDSFLSEVDNSNFKPRSHSVISNTSEQSSEDYWFTHWGRPSKLTNQCNCSFRASWRLSLKDQKFAETKNTLMEMQEGVACSLEQTGMSKEERVPEVVQNFVDDFVHKVISEALKCFAISMHDSFCVETNQRKSLALDNITPTSNESSSEKHSAIGYVNLSFVDHPNDSDLESRNDIKISSNSAKKCKNCVIHLCDHNSFKTVSCGYENSENKNFIESQNIPNSTVGNNDQFSNATSLPIPELKQQLKKTLQVTSAKVNLNEGCQETKAKLNGTPDPKGDNSVDTRNVELRCRDNCGRAKDNERLKPLMYFLHGASCSADIWLKVMKHFAKAGFEVVAPDMLGHGYSSAPDIPRLYSFNSLLKDAIDLFDKFVDDQRKCVVIGHAYGCSLATALSRYRPQQVIQLVLISGGGPTPLAPHTPDSRPVPSSLCLTLCLQPLLKCGFRRNVLYSTYGKHMVSGATVGSGVSQYVLSYLAQGQNWPEGDAAFHRRITVPTLLVHGMHDPLVPLVHECEMERTIPRSFLEVIPNAGHFAMLETPEKLIHMIRCFVDWWNK